MIKVKNKQNEKFNSILLRWLNVIWNQKKNQKRKVARHWLFFYIVD